MRRDGNTKTSLKKKVIPGWSQKHMRIKDVCFGHGQLGFEPAVPLY